MLHEGGLLSGDVAVRRLQPIKGLRWLHVTEVWSHRELLLFLTWRNLKVRYKQTFLGIIWVLLQPLLMMVVLSLLFGRFAELPSDGVSYSLLALAGLVPWQFFARSLADSTSSLLTDQRLIAKVYFPKILIPFAALLTALVDFFLALVLLVLLATASGHPPTARLLFLPFFVALLVVASTAVGLWLSALNIEYRDVMYVVPFLSQVWFFLTPVAYSSSIVDSHWRFLYGLNPMVAVVDGFRWSVFGIGNQHSDATWLAVTISVTALVTGIIWFRHRERSFVDLLGSGGT